MSSSRPQVHVVEDPAAGQVVELAAGSRLELRFWRRFIGEAQLSDLQRAQLPAKQAAGEAALALMDEHLALTPFFVGDRLTLADIALYPYTHVAEDGGFDLGRYPAIRLWLARVAAEPRHIAMEA